MSKANKLHGIRGVDKCRSMTSTDFENEHFKIELLNYDTSYKAFYALGEISSMESHGMITELIYVHNDKNVLGTYLVNKSGIVKVSPKDGCITPSDSYRVTVDEFMGNIVHRMRINNGYSLGSVSIQLDASYGFMHIDYWVERLLLSIVMPVDKLGDTRRWVVSDQGYLI